jgi:hypothetical protein
MGIRDKPIAPGSPWQNGFAERLIGSIRRECVDHVIALGETHLRRILQAYARYYNDLRTHRSLDKDAPFSRPVQRTGSITSQALARAQVHDGNLLLDDDVSKTVHFWCKLFGFGGQRMKLDVPRDNCIHLNRKCAAWERRRLLRD